MSSILTRARIPEPAYIILLICWCLVVVSGCRKQNRANTPTSPETPTASYVGDEACASCHEDLYMSYHRTGMGKSVSLFDPTTAPERFDVNTEVYHPPSGFYYASYLQNDTLFQREYRKSVNGDITYERTHAVDFVVGSGNATRSYFMNINGYITQMPLTWYSASEKWDLSPAYEQTNHRFSRAIGPQCMTCHNGLPEYSPYTQNHYSSVPLGITCERCHGPGSDHADSRLAGLGPSEGAPDPTIVNPAHLERDLNLAICQQCHLTGVTVFKPGEAMHTFKPGKPLSSNRNVFVTEEQLTDPERFGIASHATRLSQSACFQKTSMTCVTCHNPHQSVTELSEDYFNETCQSCHTPKEDAPDVAVCGRGGTEDLEELMTGNCVSCHLQKSGTSDIPHVTFTDHWIRRTLPPSIDPEEIERDLVKTTPSTLVRIESNGNPRGPDAMLEEAIAYFDFYDSQHELPDYLPRIVTIARQALAEGADHPEGRLSLGRALLELDSLQSARRVLEAATNQYPEHARIHYWLGETFAALGSNEQALASYRQTVNLSPKFNEARLRVARELTALSRLDEAEQVYLDLIAEDSVSHPQAWNNLGFLYLNMNRLQEALPLFEQATNLDPTMIIAWANAGSVHLFNGDLDLAAATFEQALEIDPSYVPAIGNLAQVYWQQDKKEEARSMLRRILAFNPSDQRARALLEQWQ